ncbi:MAG: hypothetical protein ACYCTI_01355 [Acidimicrobiales bacterium]
MRKIGLLVLTMMAVVMSVLVGVGTGGSAHRSQLAYPNFACVAAGNYGLCIGPPTND